MSRVVLPQGLEGPGDRAPSGRGCEGSPVWSRRVAGEQPTRCRRAANALPTKNRRPPPPGGRAAVARDFNSLGSGPLPCCCSSLWAARRADEAGQIIRACVARDDGAGRFVAVDNVLATAGASPPARTVRRREKSPGERSQRCRAAQARGRTTCGSAEVAGHAPGASPGLTLRREQLGVFPRAPRGSGCGPRRTQPGSAGTHLLPQGRSACPIPPGSPRRPHCADGPCCSGGGW